MNRNIRKWFYDHDFISTATGSIFNNPFWLEEDDVVIPFPARDSDEVNRCIATYYSHTLPTLGFYNLADGDEFTPIHLVGGIAVEVDQHYIRDYIKYILSFVPGGDMIIDVMTQRYDRFFSGRILNSLRLEFNRKPLKDKRNSAYRFYKNGVVDISTKDGCKLIPYSDIEGDSFVWANQIIDRDFNSNLVGEYDKDGFVSDLTDEPGNHFHKWCQNLCKERNEDGQWVYRPNRFKTLASGFGYLLHQRWNEYKCIIFVDEDLVEGKANGRTGKSVVLDDALSYALDSVTVEANGVKRDQNNKFLFHIVHPSTQYICLDDACYDFDFSALFSKITGPFTCEKKYGGIFQFSKYEKPKMGLSTNHPIIGDGPSYADRQHIVEVGGFYRFHKMELNKDPMSFHDGWLFDDDWSLVNWQEFDAFCVNALLFYLNEGLLGGRSSSNYQYKKLVNSVGSPGLVQTIQRFLAENAGKETYQKKVKGMEDHQVDRCLDEFVKDHLPNEDYSLNQLSTGLHHVASHFGYGINRGSTDKRKQKRFGPDKKGTDLYVISDPSHPFGNSTSSSDDKTDVDLEVLALFEDLDPVKKCEQQMKEMSESNSVLLPKPDRMAASD